MGLRMRAYMQAHMHHQCPAMRLCACIRVRLPGWSRTPGLPCCLTCSDKRVQSSCTCNSFTMARAQPTRSCSSFACGS